MFLISTKLYLGKIPAAPSIFNVHIGSGFHYSIAFSAKIAFKDRYIISTLIFKFIHGFPPEFSKSISLHKIFYIKGFKK